MARATKPRGGKPAITAVKGSAPQDLEGDTSRRVNPPGLPWSPPNITRVKENALGFGLQDLCGDSSKRFNPPKP